MPAVGMIAAFVFVLSTAARAATITVTTLSDPAGPSGTCSLRDAITAANTMTATNGCIAGTGNDTIDFSVAGTIALASTLPQITDSNLTMNGPTSPGITLDGGYHLQVMQVASGARVNLNNLTIANGFAVPNSGGISLGGGILSQGTLTVTGTVFSGNMAVAGSLGEGGAIYSLHQLTVTNSTFVSNISTRAGGAIVEDGSLSVTNSLFSDNKSSGVDGVIDGYGGAVYFAGLFSGRIDATTFSGNQAGVGGGALSDALNSSNAKLTVSNSTFSQNVCASCPISSGYAAGAIVNTGTLAVINSTFSGNSGGLAGAILDAFLGKTSVKGSILAGSGPSGNCSTIFTNTPIVDAGYNISDDSSCGFTKTGSANNGDGVNPLLSTAGLANNGGPTETIALQDGSFAIDAIPVADCTDQASPPNLTTTDQRGFPRPDAGEQFCDIGAYEVQDSSFISFSHFSGSLKIDPDAGVFYLWGGFTLGPGGRIDPSTQDVTFRVGSYAVTLPAGSFVKSSTGYVYQKTVNGIFLCVLIEFTRYPGNYQLLTNRIGGTLNGTTSPVPVMLTIGDNSGSTKMNATFD